MRTMGYDQVRNPVILCTRQNAARVKLVFCCIGAEAKDALRPDRGDAGELKQLLPCGGVDVKSGIGFGGK